MILKDAKIKDIKTVIGLEIHTAVTGTGQKLFSRAENLESVEANKHVDLLDIGMPGAYPVLNYDAVIKTIKAIMPFMKIRQEFSFDRKHYFYPDSPQGYQLTQYYNPIGVDGHLSIPTKTSEYKRIRIKQAHIETDAGKSLHENGLTLLDYNRCGAPLIEIVTEPDISHAEEAVDFLRLLRSTLRYTGVCDCSMELGNFRVDVSISICIGPHKSRRVEIKNLNSFKAIRRAIEFERQRQFDLLKNGVEMAQECRLFNGSETVFMRVKEIEQDYMYMPDPDLAESYCLEESLVAIQREAVGKILPADLIQRFMRDFKLSYEDAFGLIEEPEIYFFIQAALEEASQEVKQTIIKLIRRCVFRRLNEGDKKIDLLPQELREIAECVNQFSLNALLTEKLFNEIWDGTSSVGEFVKREDLESLASHSMLLEAAEEILTQREAELKRLLMGEDRLRGMFVGLIMRHFNNKADPKLVNQALDAILRKKSLPLIS